MSFKVQRIRARARFGIAFPRCRNPAVAGGLPAAPDPTVSPSMSIRQKLVKLPAKVSTIVRRKSADCGRDPAERRHHRRHRQGLAARPISSPWTATARCWWTARSTVEGPTDQLVTVYRGASSRESYSCMPDLPAPRHPLVTARPTSSPPSIRRLALQPGRRSAARK